MKQPYLLFSGTSHPKLGGEIARGLGLDLGKISIERFPDQEIGVQVLEHVRGRDVFVLQTIARHPNSYLMELLIIADALKRASAAQLTAVIPYFGYARQDRKDRSRVPITAKLVANLLETAGFDRVMTVDLHAPQIQGFFDIPVDNLQGITVLINRVILARAEMEKKTGKKSAPLVVVTPDVGSSRLAHDLSDLLGVDFAIIDKRRIDGTDVEAGPLIGGVQGADVLLVDDICSTGGTLKKAAKVCKAAGAQRIFAAVTHGLCDWSGFEESAIERIFVLDTIPQVVPEGCTRVEVVSVAAYLAKAIDHVAKSESISALFLRSRLDGSSE